MAEALRVGAAPRRPSVLRVGTVVWLASELMFFAGLFAAWFGLRAAIDDWPPPGVELETLRTALFTVLLVGSSFTFARAAHAAERGDHRTTLRWTAITALLGTLFLANQVLEYAQADFRFGSSSWASMFYLLTGFHGLHVLGGIVLMVAVLAVGLGPSSRAPLGEVVKAGEYYWHFVDVVWVGMFVTVYVIR